MPAAGAKAPRRPYTPRMSPEARREQLLDAALSIIVRDGYSAVSIEAIARAADVTRPVVYNVFDDLNALLLALLDRQEKQALEQLLTTISPDLGGGDLGAVLDGTIRDLVAMVAEDPDTWRPILLASDGTPALVRARIDRDREVVRGRIQMLVEQALAVRDDTRGIDAGVASHALLAIAEHFGRLILEAPETIDVESLASTVTALIVP
jgi:AcrR family transcriptional regulator